MQRTCIIGIPGSGKSTLARAIGQVTGVPVVHVDQHFFDANWKPKPDEVWRRAEDEILSASTWIIDGAFSMERALPLADTIVWLDFHRPRAMWWALKRNLRHRHEAPVDFAPGCEERLDKQFLQLLRYIWRYPRAYDNAALVAPHEERAHVVRLRNPRAIRRYLAKLRATTSPTTLDP